MGPKLLKFLVIVPGLNADEDVFIAEASEDDESASSHVAEMAAENSAAGKLPPGPWLFEGSWTVESAEDDCEEPSMDGIFRRLEPAELSRWGAIGKLMA